MPESGKLLAILQNDKVPFTGRHRAFEQILQLRSGFWGNGALRDFLVRAAKRKAYELVGRNGVDILDAEAIADGVLILFFEKAPRVKNPVAQFLLGAVKNLALRARDRELTMLDAVRIDSRTIHDGMNAKPIVFTAPEPVEPESAEELAAAHEVEQEVRDAVDQLPPTLQAVVKLKLWEGEDMSIVSIARWLGIKPATARQRWRRGRQRLQVILQGVQQQRRKQGDQAA